MYTRCPGCHTVHPVNAAVLARAYGQARCGKCNKSINVIEWLFDSWPDPGAQPAPSRASGSDLPELGANIDMGLHDAAPEGKLEDEGGGLKQPVEARLYSRLLWVGGLVLLLLITFINIASLPGTGISESQPMQSAMRALGMTTAPPTPSFTDLSSIQLLSRDMQMHPSVPGGLVLSATLVNRAPHRQDFPVLEVILTDKRSRPIANRYFQPSEYLSEGADSRRGMTPEALLAVKLEFLDPGAQATGFELRFHAETQ